MTSIVSLVMNALVLTHVATGFVGLAAFWIPLFARKGGQVHVQAGRVFTYCAYVVTLSAVTVSACSASTTFAAWRRLFLPVPVVVNRDQQR